MAKNCSKKTVANWLKIAWIPLAVVGFYFGELTTESAFPVSCPKLFGDVRRNDLFENPRGNHVPVVRRVELVFPLALV